MTIGAGRDFLLKMGDGETSETFNTVAGMRATGMTLNNNQIDVTNKDDAAWRALISGGIKSMDITLSGVVEDASTIEALKAAVIAEDGSDIANFQLISGLGDLWEGPFQIVSFGISGDVGKEEAYDIKLASSGRIVYTAPA